MRRWAWAALGAHVGFVLAWLAAGFWQGPRYRVVADSISDMYAVGAPGGWFLVVVLTVCGAVAIGFALWGVRPALRAGGKPAVVGAWLLAFSVYGVGDLLTPFAREGCRRADPGCTAAVQLASPGGLMDVIVTVVGVVLLMVALGFLAAALESIPGRREQARMLRRAIQALVALFFANAVAQATGLGRGGRLERLLAAAGAGVIVLLALIVLGAGSAEDQDAGV